MKMLNACETGRESKSN